MLSLNIDALSVQFDVGDTSVKALDRVSLNVPLNGYTIGVVGESGSGKTTLGMSIMNVIEPPGKIVDGGIKFLEKNVLSMTKKELLNYRWEKVSMIYQSAMNSLNPVKTVTDPIVEVLRNHKGISKQESTRIALELLSDVGINKTRANNYPHEFSGGMRQRVVIALAMALSPKILIADEPTSALDVVTQRQVLALLKRKVLEQHLSMIFITHEIALLPGMVDNIAVMYAGEIVEMGPIEIVLSKRLHPYTERLVETLLTVDLAESALVSGVDGERQSRRRAAEGSQCKYVNRCKYAFDRCHKEKPVLQMKEERLVACHKYA